MEIDPADVRINLVFWRAPSLDPSALVAFMAARGLRMFPPSGGIYRLVTHYGVSRAAVEAFAAHLKNFIARQGG